MRGDVRPPARCLVSPPPFPPFAPVFSVAVAIAACSLTTSLDGLSGGASPAIDGSTDERRADADVDADKDADASADAGEGGQRSYRDEVLADSPLLYLRLGEASLGPAASAVAGGVTGTYMGGVTFGSPGAIAGDSNTAVSLDGTGSIALGTKFAFDATATYTLEAWVKPIKVDGVYRRIFSREAYFPATRQGYLTWVQLDSGWGSERFRDGAADGVTSALNGVPPITIGAYYHLVATYDEAQLMYLYVNAVETSQGQKSTKVLASSPVALAIGCIGTTSTECFVGAIDEVAIYDHALTSSRVAVHYRKGRGMP